MLPKITVLCIGSIKKSWANDACTIYSERLQRSGTFDVIEMKDSKQDNREKKRAEESETILSFMQKFTGICIACDEFGKGYTSNAFASYLGTKRDVGESCLFIIGGAYGFTDEVRNACSWSLKLTDMTLPHELCRVVLLEQLYRSEQILGKTGYHH